jgi:hypothetical protein
MEHGSKNIPEDHIWKVMAQLTSALFECHKKAGGAGRVVHRDLVRMSLSFRCPHMRASMIRVFVCAPTASRSLATSCCSGLRRRIWGSRST